MTAVSAAPVAMPPSAQLMNRDYTLIIDKSGTMAKSDMPNGQSRWNAIKESVYAIAAKIMQLDRDGINIYVFSGRHKFYPQVKDPSVIDQIFMENEPMGGTMLAPVLRLALKDFFDKRNTPAQKPATILIVTDGEPDNKQDVVSELILASNTVQSKTELDITFIQVGKDAGATGFLNFLDNGLLQVGAKTDIVETVKMDDIEDIGLTQFLIDAMFHNPK